MATITCHCPYCEQTFRSALETDQPLSCPECSRQLSQRVPQLQAASLTRCLVCPSHELFIRKDFPQRLGVAIVCTGFFLSSVAWFYHQVILSFAILFATALVDVILFMVMGNLLECYRCHAQYRGLHDLKSHGNFDLEVHERYRQEAARLKQAGETDAAD
ncbi:MAG: hypothetical protein GY768_30400 [Planctomycetaceae bacterium]|nr:hypothetical protein [Planctomycetaceae bacterium]